jgi:hypothetical protein
MWIKIRELELRIYTAGNEKRAEKLAELRDRLRTPITKSTFESFQQSFPHDTSVFKNDSIVGYQTAAARAHYYRDAAGKGWGPPGPTEAHWRAAQREKCRVRIDAIKRDERVQVAESRRMWEEFDRQQSPEEMVNFHRGTTEDHKAYVALVAEYAQIKDLTSGAPDANDALTIARVGVDRWLSVSPEPSEIHLTGYELQKWARGAL